MTVHATATPRAQATTGVRVAAVSGLFWALWGSAGLTGGNRDVARVVASAVAALLFWGHGAPYARVRVVLRSAADRVIVSAEVLLGVGGVLALGVTESRFAPAWLAAVFAAHVLRFGGRVDHRYGVLAAALIAVAVAAVGVGALTRGERPIEACCGIAVALCLFGAGVAVARGD